MPSIASATQSLLLFATGADVPISDLDGADVSPDALARLAEAGGLSGARSLELRHRNLSGASLRLANLSHVDLRQADLSGIAGGGLLLTGAQLDGASLEGADLAGADLRGVSAGEANFKAALLEDAVMRDAQLRFANFSKSIVEGADFTGADLWGAHFTGVIAHRAIFHRAKLDESRMAGAELPEVDLSHASLRRANLDGATLTGARLQDAILDGANLNGANLTGASLPNLSLTTCNLTGVSFAGAWLERTRMRARQLGAGVGEELKGDLEGAIDSYVVLERNFLSLGLSADASWAYLRKRRVTRRLHLRRAKEHAQSHQLEEAFRDYALWLADCIAEWLCDYGESLFRVARAFVSILSVFALVYWLTGSLRPREGFTGTHWWDPVNYLLFSLDSMTTVGTSEVALRPRAELGVLLSSLQTVLGTILLGLFGFVLGARIRN